MKRRTAALSALFLAASAGPPRAAALRTVYYTDIDASAGPPQEVGSASAGFDLCTGGGEGAKAGKMVVFDSGSAARRSVSIDKVGAGATYASANDSAVAKKSATSLLGAP